jgi:hypothetical protein
MKTLFIYLVSTIFLLSSCKGNSSYSESEILSIRKSQEATLNSINLSDTLLQNIQQKVLKAFVNSKINNTDKELIALELSLLDLNKKSSNNIIIYWYSFACYYHSILLIIEKDNKKSEEILDKGIKEIESVNLKNSEHLALLALMESFSIQFAPGIQAPFISKRVKENTEKALQIDSLNLRAYYVLGSNDFYTPEQYGGGKKTESFLKKAISLKDQTVSNPYLPSWGKNSAYELLIRFYIKKQNLNEAKKYYKEAIAAFPDDYMINKLASELIKQ